MEEGEQQSVTPDNFMGLVAVLDEYAGVAGLVVEAQQQGRRAQTLNSTK